jgi:hypothetical protein
MVEYWGGKQISAGSGELITTRAPWKRDDDRLSDYRFMTKMEECSVCGNDTK